MTSWTATYSTLIVASRVLSGLGRPDPFTLYKVKMEAAPARQAKPSPSKQGSWLITIGRRRVRAISSNPLGEACFPRTLILSSAGQCVESTADMPGDYD